MEALDEYRNMSDQPHGDQCRGGFSGGRSRHEEHQDQTGTDPPLGLSSNLISNRSLIVVMQAPRRLGL